MRILFCCDEYPPAKNGGIGTVTKIVAEEFAKRGHDVFVVGTYSNATIADQLFYSNINDVHVYRLNLSAFPLKRKWDISYKLLSRFFTQFYLKEKLNRIDRFIASLIKKEKIEIIEITDYNFFIESELKIKRKWQKFNVPTVIRVHGSASFLNQLYKGDIPPVILQNDIANFLRADYISVVSHYSAKFITTVLNIWDKSIEVIYNPVELNFFEKIKPYPKKKQILYFGKINEYKGVFSLLEAFNKVVLQEEESSLCIVGSGEIERAKEFLSEEAQKRFFFKSFMNKEDLRKEIDNSYLCVLPSYAENFSMAALEVMARERLLIYTERCSGKELIEDGKNGFLIDPENSQQIAERIIDALNNPQKTIEMAKAGHKKCKQYFSTDVIIPQLEGYYQNIIEKDKWEM